VRNSPHNSREAYQQQLLELKNTLVAEEKPIRCAYIDDCGRLQRRHETLIDPFDAVKAATTQHRKDYDSHVLEEESLTQLVATRDQHLQGLDTALRAKVVELRGT
jgi:hypothetical protein